MDLKALLLEAKQKVPPVLQVLHCGDESMLDIGGDTGWETLVQWGCDGNTTEQVRSAPQRSGGLMGAQSLGHRAWPHHHADPPPPSTATPIPPGERGCAFCGGLGHRITDCPKLEAMQTKQVSNIGRKDYLAHSSMDF